MFGFPKKIPSLSSLKSLTGGGSFSGSSSASTGPAISGGGNVSFGNVGELNSNAVMIVGGVLIAIALYVAVSK